MTLRVVEILRAVAIGGLAGALAGTLVGGIGGRIVMRLAAVLNPQATGARTENGELVGAISANGTLALLFFGGLFSGVVAGIVWVVVSPWLPSGSRRRLAAAALAAAAIGSPFLVRSSNLDFRILEADGPIIAMLVILVGLVGLAIAWLDGALDRRLPRPAAGSLAIGAVYGAMTLLGLLFLPIAVGFYLSPETCGCADPPRFVGIALVVAGAATAAAWVHRVRTGAATAPAKLALVGRVAVLAAVGLGTVRVVGELTRILAT